MAEETSATVPGRVIRFGSRAEIDAMVAQLGTIVADLRATIAEETRLVRAARLAEASELEGAKRMLASAYLLAFETVKANAELIGRIAPDQARVLQELHASFRSELDVNLAVLGTARAVAEGVMRGVAEEIDKRTRLTTYGSNGVSVAMRARPVPLAVSRQM